MKLTGEEKKELTALEKKCLDADGKPLEDANTQDLVRLSDLRSKAEAPDPPAGGSDDKDKKPKKEKPLKPSEVPEVKELIGQGYRFLGTDGAAFYFYGPGGNGAFQIATRGLESVGKKFGKDFLKTLKK